MIVTKELLRSAASIKNGYKANQSDIPQEQFPGAWKSQMLGANVTEEYWDRFVAAKNTKRKKQKKVKPEIINKVSGNDGKDWAWKPADDDIPEIKVKPSKKGKNRGKNKAKRKKITRFDNESFYTSRNWRELRARVLEKYECKCMMCGRSPKAHKVIIHVDHIKPRSKHPELSLTFNNLQLLCEDCNLGKSNKYDTDWRPDLDKQDEIDKALDMDSLSNSPL